MRIWVTSDIHFGYASFYKYSERYEHILRPGLGFMDEAERTIIDNYNNLVGHNDTVYFLGDCAKTLADLRKFSNLNGNKHLIMGNHDSKFGRETLSRYFQKIVGCMYMRKHGLVLTHIPIHPQELRYGQRNLHGHVHLHTIDDPRYINACLEVNDYKPILLADQGELML